MTGTAWEERHELWRTYRCPVVRIPTHRPAMRRNLGVRIVGSRDARIAELDTLLAQKSAPVVEAKPAVVIREHRRDPRKRPLRCSK